MLEAPLSNRWKMGIEWVAEPLGIIVAEDSGVVRWVDLNPFNRTSRMSHNSNITCADARVDRMPPIHLIILFMYLPCHVCMLFHISHTRTSNTLRKPSWGAAAGLQPLVSGQRLGWRRVWRCSSKPGGGGVIEVQGWAADNVGCALPAWRRPHRICRRRWRSCRRETRERLAQPA